MKTTQEMVNEFKAASPEYGWVPTEDQQTEMKESGLLLVMGASDDLVEVYGILRDEEGAWEGATLRLGPKGFIDMEDDVKTADIEAWRENLASSFQFTAVWCDEGDEPDFGEDGYSWRYKVDNTEEFDPQVESFDVMEGAEKYCRAIVLRAPWIAAEEGP